MTAAIHATPLMALDAVVIDTETTGLDPAKARLVEIGAVRLSAGRIESARRLPLADPAGRADPGRRRPKIHGIDEAHVKDAPSFAQVWPQFRTFVGRSVVIGHAVGFDLAILKRECERAGIVFERPRMLDTRLLAANRRAGPRRLHARGAVGLARCCGDRPAFRAGRRADRGAHLSARWCRNCARAASALWPRRWRPAAD